MAEYPNIPPAKGGLLCLLVLLYNFGYVSLSKIVASRARRCALFRLASAKVRRGFELAKLSGNIFSKNLLTGRFCRVRVAIHGDKRGSEGRGGPRSGTSGNGGEGRKTEGGARRDGGEGSEERGKDSEGRGGRAFPEAELRGMGVKGGTRRRGAFKTLGEQAKACSPSAAPTEIGRTKTGWTPAHCGFALRSAILHPHRSGGGHCTGQNGGSCCRN